MFFGISLFGLAVIGTLRIINKEPLTRELNDLRADRLLLKQIVSDLHASGIIDSTKAYEHFVYEFYNSHKMSFPDLAPVMGYVTRGVHMGNNHLGIDIAAKYKDDIYAPADGRIIFSGVSDDLGNTIIMSHDGGFITVYGHNATNLVNTGDSIHKGQVISQVGDTGKSKGPHLHFEIWKNNQVLDPREIIKKYKEKDVSIR